eukprot:CAMPEP_0204491578 /NCGR_PEP_ID=MMETSP0471-20130131/77580_1 /ASSEMBLY_ACC=CAM_ASM_000602 /TAXON_ID=2969 /ORGANISM="Oxyrrhis marina" /LENGTH=53 /DNA_ID=CAMNT_0051495585 /DNA_START=460 /DNA_END=618 /DNA_ORIENTATION=+
MASSVTLQQSDNCNASVARFGGKAAASAQAPVSDIVAHGELNEKFNDKAVADF